MHIHILQIYTCHKQGYKFKWGRCMSKKTRIFFPLVATGHKNIRTLFNVISQMKKQSVMYRADYHKIEKVNLPSWTWAQASGKRCRKTSPSKPPAAKLKYKFRLSVDTENKKGKKYCHFAVVLWQTKSIKPVKKGPRLHSKHHVMFH